MEVQFEVVSCLEKKHFVQWYKYRLRGRFFWMSVIGFVGICYLALGISNVDLLHICFALTCVGYVVWNYRRPWTVAKKTMERDLEYYGTEKVSSVTTFGDVIRDVAKDADMVMHYDKIKDIYFSEDLIALTDLKGITFLMDKNGFTKGDFQSFQVFIREKCPQLKLPKWDVPEA